MKIEKEVFEGYVLDLACIRKYPYKDLFDRGRKHTKDCSLMGHCVESGYGLVNENGELRILDAKATPKVIDALNRSDKKSGIQLRAVREKKSKEMETTKVEEI